MSNPVDVVASWVIEHRESGYCEHDFTGADKTKCLKCGIAVGFGRRYFEMPYQAIPRAGTIASHQACGQADDEVIDDLIAEPAETPPPGVPELGGPWIDGPITCKADEILQVKYDRNTLKVRARVLKKGTHHGFRCRCGEQLAMPANRALLEWSRDSDATTWRRNHSDHAGCTGIEAVPIGHPSWQRDVEMEFVETELKFDDPAVAAWLERPDNPLNKTTARLPVVSEHDPCPDEAHYHDTPGGRFAHRAKDSFRHLVNLGWHNDPNSEASRLLKEGRITLDEARELAVPAGFAPWD